MVPWQHTAEQLRDSPTFEASVPASPAESRREEKQRAAWLSWLCREAGRVREEQPAPGGRERIPTARLCVAVKRAETRARAQPPRPMHAPAEHALLYPTLARIAYTEGASTATKEMVEA